MYVTLPEPDVMADGCTIPLWDCTWADANGKVTPTSIEQETNLRNAIAAKKPILGFRVEIGGKEEKITKAHPERLLPLTLVEQTAWKIVGQEGDRIVPD